MSEENVEVARGGYEDFNSGNIPGVIGRLDPEIEWTEPGGGNSPSGTFNGPDSVAQDVFPPVQENFEEFSAEPAEFKDEGDTVIVTGRFKGKAKSGAELDTAFTHTWEMRDGKVVKLNNEVEGDNWASAWGG